MAIDERELNDAVLVEAAQHGDDEAFTELFRRHYPAVRRVCTRRLGNATEADEVAQAAFVRAYERIDQCVGERRFGAWVQVIAYRLGADARRSRSRSIVTDEPIVADAALGPNHCEDELLRGEEAAAVHEILATLPPRQREVIVARDIEGRRPGEIAAALGLSLGAVDSLLLRARRRAAAAWKDGRAEGGAVSPHAAGASFAATSAAATVTDPGSLRILSHVGSAIARVSFHVADGLGLVNGGQTIAQHLTGAVVAAALAAVPMAALAAPPPIRPVAPGVIRALPGARTTGAGAAQALVAVVGGHALPATPPLGAAAVSVPGGGPVPALPTGPAATVPPVTLPLGTPVSGAPVAAVVGGAGAAVTETVGAVASAIAPAVSATVGTVTSTVATVSGSVSGLLGSPPAGSPGAPPTNQAASAPIVRLP